MDEGPERPRSASTSRNASFDSCGSPLTISPKAAASTPHEVLLKSSSHSRTELDLRLPNDGLNRGHGSSGDQQLAENMKERSFEEVGGTDAKENARLQSDLDIESDLDVKRGREEPEDSKISKTKFGTNSEAKLDSTSLGREKYEVDSKKGSQKDSKDSESKEYSKISIFKRDESNVDSDKVGKEKFEEPKEKFRIDSGSKSSSKKDSEKDSNPEKEYGKDSKSGSQKRSEKSGNSKEKFGIIIKRDSKPGLGNFQNCENDSETENSKEDSDSEKVSKRHSEHSAESEGKKSDLDSKTASLEDSSSKFEPRGSSNISASKYVLTPKGPSHNTSKSQSSGQAPAHEKAKENQLEIEDLQKDDIKTPFPPGYWLGPALKLPIQTPESITCFACHESNLYIGTSQGNLLHLHFFEDATEYMLIMQLSVNNACKPVQKILLLPDAEVCLVLCNKNVAAFTFPELSPCHIGKIRDVQDMSVLSQGQKPKSGSVCLDKVIVYTQARIRLVQISNAAVKLLKDINYSGAVKGVSTACNVQANYSKICVVANMHSYEVVDMQKPQKILLMDYNPGNVPNVHPYILPFKSPAENTEEYLLPICTEEHSSMAMFTNPSGDATKGTLTWPDLGYPTNGLVVEWPYVFGLFRSASCMQCVVSSLDTLEVVHTCKLLDISEFQDPDNVQIWSSSQGMRVFDQHLSQMSTQVYYTNGELCAAQQNSYHTSHTIFCSGSALHCLVQSHGLADKIQCLMHDLETPALCPEALSNYTEYFSGQEDAISKILHLCLLAICGNFDRLKTSVNSKTDIRLLLLFCSKNIDDPSDPFWASYTLPKVVHDLLLSWRQNSTSVFDRDFEFCSPKARDFVLWLIPTVLESELCEESIRQKFRYFSYTVGCSKTAEILEKLRSESDTWSGQNEVNEALVQYFQEKHYFVVLIEVYLNKQSLGNQFLPWEEKIVDTCLNLLSGKWKNISFDETFLEAGKITIKLGNSAKTYDLNDIICRQMVSINDEKVYTNKLLDFVSLQAEAGLLFLQKNSKSKFRSKHKEILSQVTKTLDYDSEFPFLKAQYIEQAFSDMVQMTKSLSNVDFVMAEELVDEYMQYLNGEGLDMEYDTLNSLFKAFQKENDLADPTWPKVTWMEYVSLNRHKSECTGFLEVWVKTNELLLLLSYKNIQKKFRNQGPASSYSNAAYASNSNNVGYFLAIGDYTTAEHCAQYAVPPISRRPILLTQVAWRNQFPLIGENDDSLRFESILNFYLQLSDKNQRNYAVMHLMDTFGTQKFAMNRVLDSLPIDFPLVYVEKFLVTGLMDLEEKKSEVVLKKALAKIDAKRSGRVSSEVENLISSLNLSA